MKDFFWEVLKIVGKIFFALGMCVFLFLVLTISYVFPEKDGRIFEVFSQPFVFLRNQFEKFEVKGG